MDTSLVLASETQLDGIKRTAELLAMSQYFASDTSRTDQKVAMAQLATCVSAAGGSYGLPD